jgi:hypothetical protein
MIARSTLGDKRLMRVHQTALPRPPWAVPQAFQASRNHGRAQEPPEGRSKQAAGVEQTALHLTRLSNYDYVRRVPGLHKSSSNQS